MKLSEGAPALIWSTGVAAGAVSHTVVDMLMLRPISGFITEGFSKISSSALLGF